LAVFSLAMSCLAVMLSASPASAALCANWNSPAQGVVGSDASVSFRTFAPFSIHGDTYTLKPHAFPDYPFDIQAISPRGEASRIDMAPSTNDDQVWLGDLTPDQEGAWTLTIVNLQGADAICYRDAVLVVEEGVRSETPTFAVLGLVVILGGVASYLLMRWRRSRSTPG
jgi:hypothetical protein